MNSLWGNVFKGRRKEEETICSILGRLPIFEGLSRRELAQIERVLHQREYRPDEVIFLQGDPGLGMYIIESGTVEIVQEPLRHLFAELGPGDFFGELALLDESPRSATAVARTACRIFCLFQPDLFDLVNRSPRLGVKILTSLARTIGERLKTLNENLRTMKANEL
jgi:CRP-like cAMP-binding protein